MGLHALRGRDRGRYKSVGGITTLNFLDCFCGMGGASMGFAKEGFDCTGIDIINVGYPYYFIEADILTLKGQDFKGYDVIWGSPPCREFSNFAQFAIARVKNRQKGQWKKPPNIDNGLELVITYLKFVEDAKPKIWVMENVPNLAKYIPLRPVIEKAPIGKTMRRSFWGTFPPFLMPCDLSKKPISYYHSKMKSWERAKIPFQCSQAFAKACKHALENNINGQE